MTKPLVTVAMPVRNCEKTVAVAMRSILNQTFQDWEVLVIDDGSSDGTVAEVRRFQDKRIVLHLDGQRKGLPARLNEAIAVASGEYFARMDGDDVSYPNRLELQLKYLRCHPEVDLVGGGVLVFGNGGRVIGRRIPPESHHDICRRPNSGFPMAHPTYFGKTGWFRCFRYREDALRAEDQDMLLRAFRKSRYANLPAIVLGYFEPLNLSKILRSRYSFARSVLAESLRNGQPIAGWRGVLEQYLKGAVDIVAVVTGLRFHLLRHRARPATSEDVSQWQQVWQSANQPP